MILLPSLAVAVGVTDAIVLQQVQYWVRFNEERGDPRSVSDGRVWTYNTLEAWQEQMPFFSRSTIVRTLASLRDRGLIRTANLAPDPRDRTLSYCIEYDALDALLDGETDSGSSRRTCSERTGASVQNEHADVLKMSRSYKEAETTSETTPEGTLSPDPASRSRRAAGSPDDDGRPLVFAADGSEIVPTPETDGAKDEDPPGSARPPTPKKAKAKKPAPVFAPESRAYAGAAFLYAALGRIGSRNVLAIEKAGKRDATLQAWALHVERLVTLDEATWEEVAEVLDWLVQRDDFWLPKGNLQTAAKLREKNREGVLWHRVFLDRARADRRAAPAAPDAGLFDRMRARSSAPNP